jgi:hypothetical protein
MLEQLDDVDSQRVFRKCSQHQMLIVCRYPYRLAELPLQFLSTLWGFRDVNRELVADLKDVRPPAIMGANVEWLRTSHFSLSPSWRLSQRTM